MFGNLNPRHEVVLAFGYFLWKLLNDGRIFLERQRLDAEVFVLAGHLPGVWVHCVVDVKLLKAD